MKDIDSCIKKVERKEYYKGIFFFFLVFLGKKLYNWCFVKNNFAIGVLDKVIV